MAQIIAFNYKGGVAIQTPKNYQFTNEIKQIPSMLRSFSMPYWIFDHSLKSDVSRLIEIYFNQKVVWPELINWTAQIEEHAFDIEYIGKTKERDNNALGNRYASGRVGGYWTVTLTEDALKTWFNIADKEDNQPPPSIEDQSYYEILGISQAATAEEIKKAYRQMARVWHPDVNKEEEAESRFKMINEANQVLNDSMKRKRYDAGLKFERDSKIAESKSKKSFYRDFSLEDKWGYRSPLTCGRITAKGYWSKPGKFTITSIVDWSDITDATGKIMVSYWNRNTNDVTINWI